MSEKTLVEIESEKPPLGNFTMSEYTEKVIQYGLMMVRNWTRKIIRRHANK